MRVSLVVIALIGLVVVACHPDERTVYVENRTTQTLRLTMDGEAFVPTRPLRSGETSSFVTREREWSRPRILRAYDEQGNLRFERELNWEQLEASAFRVSITEDAPAR